jgi:hypothetical protein
MIWEHLSLFPGKLSFTLAWLVTKLRQRVFCTLIMLWSHS